METEGFEIWNDPAVKALLKKAGAVAPTTAEEERKLCDDLRGNATQRQSAGARLVESHQRMVVSMAKNYMGRGISLQDLIQEGILGLFDALSKFDASRARFSTYSSWYVRNRLNLLVANSAQAVRMPISARRKNPGGQRITMVDIETPLGVGDLTLADTLVDENCQDPVESRSEADLKNLLASALSVLDERERAIVEARFGIDRDQEETLGELGERFGISRERIRQIEAGALKKLARSPQASALASLLG